MPKKVTRRPDQKLGKIAYEGYYAARSKEGMVVPPWERLPKEERAAWQAAGSAVATRWLR